MKSTTLETGLSDHHKITTILRKTRDYETRDYESLQRLREIWSNKI